MSIDPKGTAPGLQKEPEESVVNIACRAPKCKSITATVLNINAAPGTHVYRCTECGYTKGVTVGGVVNF